MVPSRNPEQKRERQGTGASTGNKDRQLSFTPVTGMRAAQSLNVDYMSVLRNAAQSLQQALENLITQDSLCLLRGTVVWYVCLCISYKRGRSGGG